NAIDRLGMTDHGPVHVKIVMNIAVKLLRLLADGGVPASVVTAYGLDVQDAEVVVALGALFHDVGLSITRPDHETYSLFVAPPKLASPQGGAYDVATPARIRSAAPRAA